MLAVGRLIDLEVYEDANYELCSLLRGTNIRAVQQFGPDMPFDAAARTAYIRIRAPGLERARGMMRRERILPSIADGFGIEGNPCDLVSDDNQDDDQVDRQYSILPLRAQTVERPSSAGNRKRTAEGAATNNNGAENKKMKHTSSGHSNSSSNF